MVKNFPHAEVDFELKELNSKSILLANQNIGTYLATAIRASKGEILVFLDDDDEFFPDKLDYVQSIFSMSKDIGYFHNDRIIIDNTGKEIESGFREGQVRYIRKIGELIASKPIPSSAGSKLIKAAGYGYMSSISIKKEILIPCLQYLHQIESLQDFFMYYCALLSPFTLVIQSKRLTKYRVHSQNVSVFQHQSEEDLRKKIASFLNREKRAMEAIQEMASEKYGQSVIKKMAMYDLYLRKLNLDMVDNDASRRRILADSLSFFRFSFKATLINQISIFGRSLMYVVDPTHARRFFIRRFSFKIAEIPSRATNN